MFLNTKTIIKKALIYKKDKQFSKMISYYLLAVKHNNIDALCELGDHFMEINSKKQMIKYLLLAIKKNSMKAMYMMGKYYENHYHDKQMIKYYKMAAENNCCESMLRLINYYSAEDVDEVKKIRKYLLKMIKLNDTDILKDLENKQIFCDGLIKISDEYERTNEINKFEKYILIAIELNYTPAMIRLSYYYEKVKQFDKMVYYLDMAGNLKDGEALYLLGSYYEKNVDINKMLEYYIKAVDNENTRAMTALGLYYESIGDIPNMKKYYEIGINNNDIYSMYNYGNYYINNNDYDNAQQIFEKIVENLVNLDIEDRLMISKIYYFLGIYYKGKNETTKMVLYFKKSLDYYDSNAKYILLNYYRSIKDITNMLNVCSCYSLDYRAVTSIINMKKYFNEFLGYKKSPRNLLLHSVLIYVIEKYYNNDNSKHSELSRLLNEGYNVYKKSLVSELYKLYNNNTIKVYNLFENHGIIIEIERNNKTLNYYVEQKRLNNIMENCLICYNNNVIKIKFKTCTHSVCSECYVNVNKCYFRCK